jgi:hypothetical protein
VTDERDALLAEQRAQIEDLRRELELARGQLAQKDEFTSSNPKGPLVEFLTPSYVGCKAEYVRSLVESMRLLAKNGYRTRTVFASGVSIISNARTWLFGQAVEDGADVHVMIDSDIGWNPGDLLYCVEQPEPMVVIPVPIRNVDLETMIDRERKVEGILFNVWPQDMNELRKREQKSDLVRIDGAGGAFTVMKKDAALSLIRHYPDLEVRISAEEKRSWALWHPILKDKVEWGEDTSFFHRWHLIGGQTWALVGSPTSHSGELVLEGRLLEKLNPDLPDESTRVYTGRYGG